MRTVTARIPSSNSLVHETPSLILSAKTILKTLNPSLNLLLTWNIAKPKNHVAITSEVHLTRNNQFKTYHHPRSPLHPSKSSKFLLNILQLQEGCQVISIKTQKERTISRDWEVESMFLKEVLATTTTIMTKTFCGMMISKRKSLTWAELLREIKLVRCSMKWRSWGSVKLQRKKTKEEGK